MIRAIAILIATVAPWAENPEQLATFTVDAASEFDHKPVTLLAIMWHESRFKPKAVSKVGACGIMQVMPKFSPFSCEELKRPQIGIYEGARVLAMWKGSLAHYGGGNRRSRAYERQVLRYVRWLYGKIRL